MDNSHWIKTILILILAVSSPAGVQTTWWYLSQVPLQALSAVPSNGVICDNIPGLVGKQKRLCRRHADVMISVVRGAKICVRECQYQFKDSRWNCSTSKRDFTVFGKVMLIGSRESAFVHAISSAAVVHAITKSCSSGNLISCACDPNKKGESQDRRGQFNWGGCSDNVHYGSQFTRQFVDAKERRIRDARALMNIHNNRAGRKAVNKYMKLECKCHGVSGSCAIRTCWLAMQDFRKVGSYLRSKHSGAIQVMMNQVGTGLIVTHQNYKKPTRTDLVYFEESPDYCIEDPQTGSLGTAGRECKRSSLGPEGCDIMCCGRGYDTTTVKRVKKCDCKFHWCCYVKCKKCEEIVDIHTCKGPNPTPKSHV